MTNEEAIKILEELQDNLFNVDVSLFLHYDHSLDEIINILRNQPEWIPCSEMLPEEGQIVLATHLGGLEPSRQVIEHIYSGGKFLLNWEMDMEMLSPTFGQRYMGEVVAWQPLPEPYREKEGGAE